MTVLASGMSYADLEFQGLGRIIATIILQGADGIAIVDPGPTTTLPRLKGHLALMGASIKDVTTLMLTHIHLDHAGATGTLLRENPRIRVNVHEVGAPHLVDPAKLLASAGRLYGDAMGRLWGDVLPVDRAAIVPLRGGERIDAGGRGWEVAHTPGHASHHVSYFSADTGMALVGDTAGVRLTPGGFVLPPTPPPDIDIPQWMNSLAVIERWRPQSMFLTHFGPTESVAAHLAELREHLQLTERLAREAMGVAAGEPEREAWFADQVRKVMGRRMTAADMGLYEVACRFDLNWRGIARYVTKRDKA